MSKSYPLVSIVIPVYNGANYLREAIDSALAQTYQNIEILVINDGSTDNGQTDRIAREYGDRIRYFVKENGGVSTALNYGIRKMCGEYFSWLSHDDVYTPDKIEKAVQALETVEKKDTLVVCQSVHIDSNSSLIKGQKPRKFAAEIYPRTWNEVLTSLLRNGSMNGCAFLIHRSVFENVGLFDEQLRFNQDGLMWTKIFLHGYDLLELPDVCVKNRIHAKQLTQTGQSMFRSDCETMSRELIPALLEVSTKQDNFILEYIRYNAKYRNFSVVRCACSAARVRGRLSVGQSIDVVIRCLYGMVRPMIRKLYYALFRGIRTT